MQYLEESSELRIIEYHHQSLQREKLYGLDYVIMSENSINKHNKVILTSCKY